MRHPTINGTHTARKFAASGRQKGAPGDSPVFRIIIRLENALCRRREPRLSNGRDDFARFTWPRPSGSGFFQDLDGEEVSV
jgi:hypothetical protein